MKIVDVVAMEDHILFVETEDGTTGLFDVKPYLGVEVCGALREHAEFAGVHNGGYFLEWACGADLSADTIEAHLEPAPPELAKHLARRGPNAARESTR